MGRRIGLLGGTFDPPHVGHLVVAECARVELGLDEVRLLVAGDPWMKAPVAPAQARLELVERAVADSEGLVADPTETRLHGTTYTVETVEKLRAAQPDAAWTLLIGADLVEQLDRWHRHQDLRALVEIVVVDRPGRGLDAVPSTAGFRRLSTPLIGISSSELRERYATGRATRHLVPSAVDAHIRRLGLYGARDG